MAATVSTDMSARVAERRAFDWSFSWPAGTDVAALSDADIVTIIEAEDAQALALAERDRADEDSKLAAHGLARGQIVQAAGRGAHYDSYGAEVVDIEGAAWRINGIDGSGRIVLAPTEAGHHAVLVRPEQIA